MNKLTLIACVLALFSLAGCKLSDVLGTVSADIPTIEEIANDTNHLIGSIPTSRSVHSPPDTAKLHVRELTKH